ncbi:tetraspanin-11 [Hyalella azteca]|uniref:Tetraspanin n=1 Tax=Hyalella azteca TaxID=294128 RepID=A0A8B7NNR2_HYAAZ|nr:tetraspanin-11 [Hyalella azteca]
MGHGAEMDGCGKCARIFMFISNFIIWVGSILLLALGIWTVVDKPYLEDLLGTQVYAAAAYIIIAVGVVAFFISFLGCFGALKEIKCLLLLYFIITLLLFIVLLVGGILGYVYRGKAQETVHTTLIQKVREYDPASTTSRLTRAFDDTQAALKCCGVDGRGDWVTFNKNFATTGKQVPKSCCMTSSSGNLLDCETAPNNNTAYAVGCYADAKEMVEYYGLIIGGVGVIIALLMLLGLVFSMVLFKMIN